MFTAESSNIDWKVSKYVSKIALPHVGTLLIYAGIDGRLVEIPREFRAAADAILDDPNGGLLQPDLRLLALFKDEGILVPSWLDETGHVLQQAGWARNTASNHLMLTLCPTIDCNFRCTYCYQHHIPKVMSESVQDRIVDWVRNREPAVSSLNVTWFGGEPLLGLKAVERLSKCLRSVATIETYTASIITNGWLLTKETSSTLADLAVSTAQVTLDGPRDIHDLRRPAAGSRRSTFDRIITNLADCDLRLKISVRVNVDKDNAAQIDPLLFDQLDRAGLRGRISVYFAPVVAYTDVCADTAGSCLAGHRWSKLQAQLTFRAYLRGYHQPSLPRAKTSFCTADNVNGLVINPSGLVFNCWNDVTHPDKALMNLMDDKQTADMEGEIKRWESWNPSSFSECHDCKTLPQCMSGCPHLAMSQEDRRRGSCGELRYNLPETVAMYYLATKQGEQLQAIDRKLAKLDHDRVDQ